MQTIKGGYSFAEFDTDPNFSNPIRIEGLLKAGTGYTPKTLTEEAADNKPLSAAKGVDLSIRSKFVNSEAGSPYALLKQYEESQTPLYFRLVKILGDALSIHNCDTAWDEYIAAGIISQPQTDVKKEGTASNLVARTSAGAGPMKLATAVINKNLSTVQAIKFWFSTWPACNAGDFEVMIDDTAQCNSPLQSFLLPALNADEWKEYIYVLNNPAALTNIISIGVKWNASGLFEKCAIDDVRGVNAIVSVVKAVTVNVNFEQNEAGKFNAMKVTGSGLADTESDLYTINS
jgi:hypothetical protein